MLNDEYLKSLRIGLTENEEIQFDDILKNSEVAILQQKNMVDLVNHLCNELVLNKYDYKTTYLFPISLTAIIEKFDDVYVPLYMNQLYNMMLPEYKQVVDIKRKIIKQIKEMKNDIGENDLLYLDYLRQNVAHVDQDGYRIQLDKSGNIKKYKKKSRKENKDIIEKICKSYNGNEILFLLKIAKKSSIPLKNIQLFIHQL